MRVTSLDLEATVGGADSLLSYVSEIDTRRKLVEGYGNWKLVSQGLGNVLEYSPLAHQECNLVVACVHFRLKRTCLGVWGSLLFVSKDQDERVHFRWENRDK